MKRLPEPPYICLVTGGESTSHNFLAEKAEIVETVRQAATEGINMVQIREKSLSGRQLYDLVSAVVVGVATTEVVVVVNDRIDVALAAGADGVHLPESSMPVAVVRGVFPGDYVIGVSTHSAESARHAARGGADYIYFGPVFATPGKDDPTGLSSLSDVCLELEPFPVLGIGGIDERNCNSVIDAGAAGVAAIRALNDRDARSRMIRNLTTGG